MAVCGIANAKTCSWVRGQTRGAYDLTTIIKRASSAPDTSQSSQVNHSAVLAPEERICRRKPRNRIWGGIDVRDSCHLTAIVQTESLRIGAPQCAQIPYLPILPEEPSGLGSIREPSSGNRAKRKDQEWC